MILLRNILLTACHLVHTFCLSLFINDTFSLDRPIVQHTSRIFMGVSHAIPIFHRRPPWRRRFKASNKLVHIVLRYTIGIHPVPIPGEHINDVLGISLCPTAEELGRQKAGDDEETK